MKAQVVKQIPMESFGQPEDIALAALYLAGPSGRYVTGQVLTVDGGMVDVNSRWTRPKATVREMGVALQPQPVHKQWRE